MAKKRVSFSIEEQTDEVIAEFAKMYQDNKSMALDMLVADWQYLTARFVAQSRRDDKPVDVGGNAE